MIDRRLHMHLAPLARARRNAELLRRLTWVWMAAAAAGLLFLLIYRASGWSSPGVFILLLGGAGAGSVGIWFRTRRKPLDVAAVVRDFESENPRTRTLLQTAIEQAPAGPGPELSYLQERVIREALAENHDGKWQRRATSRLRRTQYRSLAALGLLSVVLLALYRATPPPYTGSRPAIRGVEISPGDTTVEKGSSLVVLATFGAHVPAEAVLVLRPTNEPEQRIPLTRNLEDPVFGTSVPNLRADLSYHIEYGPERTRAFRVTTFEFPRLERADARITYPDYTRLPVKTLEDTRRVSAVEGSRVEYTFHLNKPVRSAQLVPVASRPGNGTNVVSATPPSAAAGFALRADTNQPEVYVFEFPMKTGGRFELRLVDEAGRTNKLPPLFVFEAISNRPPELRFVFPTGDQRVSALEEMRIQAEATDDFGLRSYGLAYNLAGRAPQEIVAGTNAGPHEKRAFQQLIALETLGAQPDQLLSYYLWAEDIGPEGEPRRVTSDMFFAEVRPFEEIFREGQPQDPNQSQQPQPQNQGGPNAAGQLAELQKQIITATWNLQRRELTPPPTHDFSRDAGTVKESQDNALKQVRSRMEEGDDPRAKALLQTAAAEMSKAADQLATAASDNSATPLPAALAAAQSAYQALLRLGPRETQVAQNQRGQPGQSSRGQRAQRQLDQLELRQTQNRYETERQASLPQNQQQREQLQAFNRLKELAQRQQDVNERLRELQSALQAARTAAEREELQARLKRLQEEQQQMVAAVDELRQSMERPDNQSPMAEARRQLDQTREQVQQTSAAMQRGEVAEALATGTRAQRDLQQMRDDFRRQNSSQFADALRELRRQARELTERQEQLGRQLDAMNDRSQRPTLTDSDERQALASQLDTQKQRRDELVNQATEVTQQAEPVEPLLARQLYETLRQAAQADARDLQETSDDLLTQGRLRQSVYDRLQEGRRTGQNAVTVSADLLRAGFSTEADNLEERARRSLNQLKSGVDRAAESVLGDETEALRLARSELEELGRQLERELSQNESPNTGATPNEREQQGAGAEGRDAASPERQPGQNEAERQVRSSAATQPGGGQQAEQADQGNQTGPAAGERPGLAGGNRPAEGRNSAQTDAAPPNGNGRTGAQPANRAPGNPGFLDQFGGGTSNGGNPGSGPIAGGQFTQWTDRLRDVEEMLDLPELRTEAARIRDRARQVRQESQRHAGPPQWNLVKTEIAAPLAELRQRVAEELARRESKEALVPIDRDPVPVRYSELVRRYYEELGRSGNSSPPPQGSKP